MENIDLMIAIENFVNSQEMVKSETTILELLNALAKTVDE